MLRKAITCEGSVLCPGVAGVPMTLVFGCQSADTDHLYKEEVLELKRRGIFRSVNTAYSRQPSQAKVSSSDCPIPLGYTVCRKNSDLFQPNLS